MRVILLQDVRGTGKKNEVKEVSDGHGKNFLIPRGLAKMADAGNLGELSVTQKNEKAIEARLKQIAESVSARELVFYLKTDKSGAVFGSVNKDEILAGLRDAGLITKDRVEIKIPKPFKELGIHEAEINLKKGIKAKLKVRILPAVS
ncbi:MAG: 50S ribosomal protein L9 [Candidatus Liptonbacteria bacterium]|nr:50S ribosomal protein L9 [Candidatus Liptonbacteria bacterium]